MKNTKVKFAILLFLTPIISFGQNVKTYSGEYENGQVIKGRAKFSYYEDSKTMEYVKHGSFLYTRILKGDYGNYVENFSGNYKNGKKDGLWTYIITEKDYPTQTGYYTGTIKLTSNFSKGIPNGLWVYSCQLSYRNKTYGGWTVAKNEKPENVTATFKNGVLVGKISFLNNPSYQEYNSITGQLTDNGFLTGKLFLRSSTGYEETMELKNGIMGNWVVREIKTGKISDKSIDDPEMVKIKEDFALGKLKNVDLEALNITIDTINAGKIGDQLFYYDFSESFNLSLFYPRYITGDDSYFCKEFDDSLNDYYQVTGWQDKRNYGKIIRLKKSL